MQPLNRALIETTRNSEILAYWQFINFRQDVLRGNCLRSSAENLEQEEVRAEVENVRKERRK